MTFDEILQRLLIDAQNRDVNGTLDLSLGSETYIRFVAVASCAWGLYKQGDWTRDQIFPSSASAGSLEQMAGNYGIDVTGLTSAEILVLVLDRLQKPAAGGKTRDYERWALKASSAGKAFPLIPTMLSSGSPIDATALVKPKQDSIGWELLTENLGEYIVIDLGVSTPFYGLGIGNVSSRTGTFLISYSDNATDWVDLGSLDALKLWTIKTFTEISARYIKIQLQTLSDIESWWVENLHPFRCIGFEVYVTQGEIEQAVTSQGHKNYYGIGTVLVVVTPNGLSQKCLLDIETYLDYEGPIAPREIWVKTPTETSIAIRMQLNGALSSISSFQSEVAQYFASLSAGQIFIPAQIEVYALKYGAIVQSLQLSLDGGTTWYESGDPIVPGTMEVFVSSGEVEFV